MDDPQSMDTMSSSCPKSPHSMGAQDLTNNTGDTGSIGSMKPYDTESDGTGMGNPSIAPKKDPLEGIEFYCYKPPRGNAQYYVCQRSGHDLDRLAGPEESWDAMTELWQIICGVVIAPGTRETSRRRTGGWLRIRTGREEVTQARSILNRLENMPEGGWIMSKCLSLFPCDNDASPEISMSRSTVEKPIENGGQQE